MRCASPASTRATIVSATTPIAGTAVTSVRSLNDTADSLVAVSTVSSVGLFSVASGFIAARTTSSSPVEMPPSVPPASVLPRRYSPASASHEIGSWASLPRRPATSNPSPISTPLTAWMLMTAWASSASSLRSQCTWLPRPTGHAEPEHLDDATERVAVLGRGLDLGDHRLARVEVEAAHLVLVDPVELVRASGGRRVGGNGGRAHLDDVGDDVDAERLEERLGHRAGGDAGRGLPGARPFEHVAGIGEPVLLHAGEVGVAGADLGQRILGGTGRRAHLLVPLVAAEPFGVLDLDGDRRAERAAVADAADEGQLVLLETLARAAPVSEASPGHLGLDLLDGDLEPGGESLDHDHQRLAVRFSGGEVTKHSAQAIRRPRSAPSKIRFPELATERRGPTRDEHGHIFGKSVRGQRAARADFGGGAHHGHVGEGAEPALLLQRGLVDQHPETVDGAGTELVGGGQPGGAQRVVDEVDHDLGAVQQGRVARQVVDAGAARHRRPSRRSWR